MIFRFRWRSFRTVMRDKLNSTILPPDVKNVPSVAALSREKLYFPLVYCKLAIINGPVCRGVAFMPLQEHTANIFLCESKFELDGRPALRRTCIAGDGADVLYSGIPQVFVKPFPAVAYAISKRVFCPVKRNLFRLRLHLYSPCPCRETFRIKTKTPRGKETAIES